MYTAKINTMCQAQYKVPEVCSEKMYHVLRTLAYINIWITQKMFKMTLANKTFLALNNTFNNVTKENSPERKKNMKMLCFRLDVTNCNMVEIKSSLDKLQQTVGKDGRELIRLIGKVRIKIKKYHEQLNHNETDVISTSLTSPFKIVRHDPSRQNSYVPKAIGCNFNTQRAHIVPGQFLKAALDNLNFHSETEDGGNVDATTNIIYQYSSGEETADCVVRVPYDLKVRRRTIQMAEKFQPVSSELTLKERKEAQSLCSVDLKKDINDHIESLSAVSTLLECIRTDCEQQDKDSVVRHVGQVRNHLNSLLIVWEEFENSLGKTAKLWEMYIDMVLIFKRYINAERALEATPR
ncbi:hypothetical protein GQR58_011082 [Nymphon striatum]|nr:hypothetical protein GQR58_011082 [Nymphon striatum]